MLELICFYSNLQINVSSAEIKVQRDQPIQAVMIDNIPVFPSGKRAINVW